MQLNINNRAMQVPDEWQEETLLTVLREVLGLVGAKFGCGVGLCGACTVLIEGQAQRSCLVSAKALGSRAVVTIEELAQGGALHPVQQAWLTASVPQCGYCQSGQIMSTVALLRRAPKPTDAQIDEALAGNLCRCGTQQRIREAVHSAARLAGRKA
ncbi:MAG: (2Fe-2S)-binding protein [Burkholderiaceae bacterium]